MREKSRVLVSMGLLLSLSVGNFITPTKSFSNKENKYLQGFPNINYNAIISGKFTKEFETFTTDQFIFRDNWIGLKTIGDLSLLKKDNGRVYFGKDGYLFDIDKEIDKEQLEKNIKSINVFLAKMKEANIPVNSILVPSKSTILKEQLPNYAPVIDEKDIANILKEKLDSEINLVEIDKVLGNRADKYIYYKTDHHWTTRGAFYAYEYYMKSMGLEALSEEKFHIKEVSKDFWGTNYRKANYYKGNPDSIFIYESNQVVEGLYEESFLNKTDKYSYFLGGDKPLMEINTPIKNGKSILIIKDSFANSFVPFLTNHYERIVIVDPRYYNMNMTELVKEENIDEVLFFFNIQNYAREKSLMILGK